MNILEINEKLERALKNDKDNVIRWNPLVAQQDRQDLLGVIKVLSAEVEKLKGEVNDLNQHLKQ